MQILVNTDNQIDGTEASVRQVESEVRSVVERFAEQITRIEVHLTDVNSHKEGDDDKRCLMEARLAGLEPVVVSDQGSTLREAIDGAIEKLEQRLQAAHERMRNRKGRTSFAGGQGV
jgi:ribosomal subunit interface protein